MIPTQGALEPEEIHQLHERVIDGTLHAFEAFLAESSPSRSS